MKNAFVVILVLVAFVAGGLGVYLLTNDNSVSQERDDDENNVTQDNEVADDESPDAMEEEDPSQTIIGQSVEGRDIIAYHYLSARGAQAGGDGEKELVLVGGIHGGYSPNTSLLAYETITWLDKDKSVIPEGVKVTVIPALNPDGLYEATGIEGQFTDDDIDEDDAESVAGRFNANDVDLNRNFDCQWSSTATWRSRDVDGGTEAFSEPETKAVRDYINSATPAAVVVYYSAAGGVYASGCDDAVSAESVELTNLYAEAADYPAHETFDSYATTGDMANWLAKKNIPSTSVLLSDHLNSEWSKNRAGIEAVMEKL